MCQSIKGEARKLPGRRHGPITTRVANCMHTPQASIYHGLTRADIADLKHGRAAAAAAREDAPPVGVMRVRVRRGRSSSV